MAELDSGFDDTMKKAVKGNRMDLVDSIMNIQDILDYLIEKNIFVDGEDILQCSQIRKEQVRRFLDKLITRAAEGFWEFLMCLYQPRIQCGHLANAILNTYEREGGTVREDVQMVRQRYLNSDNDDGYPDGCSTCSGAAQAQGVARPAPEQYRSQRGMVVTTDTASENGQILPV